MSVATTRPPGTRMAGGGEAFRGLLRGHRLRLGWSQDGLAARAGMDLSRRGHNEEKSRR